eukprot:767481-Hanusia_phi.AAC.3
MRPGKTPLLASSLLRGARDARAIVLRMAEGWRPEDGREEGIQDSEGIMRERRRRRRRSWRLDGEEEEAWESDAPAAMLLAAQGIGGSRRASGYGTSR